MACDGGFVTLVDMILPGRGLLGNRSHAWLDTVASFGLEYERALGPAGHLKDEAGWWLGVNWLRGLRSTQEAVVRPSRACREFPGHHTLLLGRIPGNQGEQGENRHCGLWPSGRQAWSQWR